MIIGVIMVLTMLTVAVTARTMSGLASTKKGQDFSGALPQADAGLSEALFRFDQVPRAVLTWSLAYPAYYVGISLYLHAKRLSA